MDKGREGKPHLGIFGRRNLGKSSLINAFTGQDVAIVSEQPGTTTDPVKKTIEIFDVLVELETQLTQKQEEFNKKCVELANEQKKLEKEQGR